MGMFWTTVLKHSAETLELLMSIYGASKNIIFGSGVIITTNLLRSTQNF